MSAAAEPLPALRIADLAEPEPGRRWLVEGLWTTAAVGIIGGAPKCHKSWLALELAVSVASGARCLGAFEVHERGPALLFMAEDDAATVKARVAGICRYRGLDLGALDAHLITASSLRLDREQDRRALEALVVELRPRLLVLDPFVRLHRLDENDAGHISGLLAYLRELQRRHQLAVVVVHHTRKNGLAGGGGQNLRGSGDFHAWVDSSLYLRIKRSQLWLSAEHRAAPAFEPLALELTGDEQQLHLELLEPAETEPAERDLAAELVAALSDQPRTRTELRAALRVRNERLGAVLVEMQQQRRIERRGGAWRLIPQSAS